MVFVHGLGGDAYATWRHGADDATSWPHWLGQEFPEVGVWSLGYPASPTKWARLNPFSNGPRDAGYGMALPDRALQVLDLMAQKGFGERPLFFICHSLGGLVAKQILRTSSDADEERLTKVFSNTRAVLFLATPHGGAELASLVDLFRAVFGATVTIEDLKAHDPHLRNLYNWYRNHAPKAGIQTASYFEQRGVKGLLSIVNPTSAHPGTGSDPVGLDEDHLSIAKPRARDHQVCGAANELLRNFVLKRPPAARTTSESSTPIPLPPREVRSPLRESSGAGQLKTEEPRFPHVPAPCNLPHRNPQFTGRSEPLERLRASLAHSSIVSGVQAQAVYGQPGVGKSQLALEYAHRYASGYDLIWWVPAETAALIPAAFDKLATQLKLPQVRQGEQPADQQVLVEAVLDHLAHRTRWLLIFDNATNPDTLTPYLPTIGGGQVIITSRNPNWHQQVTSPLSLDLLPLEEAAQFLLGRTGRNDETSARALAEELGRLPLALEQAAAYMSQSNRSLSDYLALFRRRRDALLALGDPIAYQGTIDTTVHMATDRLADFPAALMLLKWCAFMAPEKIPLDVLARHKDLFPPEMPTDEFDLDAAIGKLWESSLVGRGDGMLNLHRLSQAVIRSHLSPEDKRAWAGRTIELLFKSFPASIDDLASSDYWERCEQLLAHGLAATKHAQEAKVAGELTMHLGSYLQHRGEYAEARTLFERALTLTEAAYGREHLKTANVLNALGYVCRAQNHPDDAWTHHYRALRIINAVLPPEHADVASTLNNLGRTLYDQKKFTEAQSTLKRALDISRIAFAPNHPEVASILNNMGRVYYAQGNLAKARAAHEQALAIKEAAPAFGPEHPSVGATLASLGRVLLAEGDSGAARIALERADKIQDTPWHRNHPDRVVTLEDLGTVCEKLGDLEGAKTARERSRAISQVLLSSPRRIRPHID